MSRIFVFALLLFAFPVQASVTSLVFTRSFSASSPDGIAFDPANGTLFTVDSFASKVCHLTIQGSVIACFAHTFEGFPEGIDVLPSGNLVVVDEVDDQVTEYTQSGEFVSASVLPAGGAPTGVVFHTGTQSYFNTDDDDLAIYEFAGPTLLGVIDTSGFPANDPEGIDFDPVTGNLYMVSDDDQMLYEITLSGNLVSQLDLFALTGFADPEGVAYDSDTNTFYIAFDNDGSVAVLVPEPGAALLHLGALVSMGLLRSLRRCHRV